MPKCLLFGINGEIVREADFHGAKTYVVYEMARRGNFRRTFTLRGGPRPIGPLGDEAVAVYDEICQPEQILDPRCRICGRTKHEHSDWEATWARPDAVDCITDEERASARELIARADGSEPDANTRAGRRYIDLLRKALDEIDRARHDA